MAITYVQRLRSFNRDVRLFLLAAALIGFSWSGLRAVLLNLYLLRLGFGTEFIGLLAAVGTLVFSLSCLPAGAFGSRWSSRRMVMLGIGLMAVGTGLLPLAEFMPPTWRAGWLLGTTLPANLGWALYMVDGMPFMMAATSPEERSHVFSVQVAQNPLAGFAGSLVGGVLPGLFALLLGVSTQDPAAYRYPLLLSSLMLVPGVLVLLPTRVVDVQWRGVTAGGSSLAPYGLILVIALLMGLRHGARGVSVTFFNVYMDDGLGVPTASIGAWVAAAQLLAVPAALGAPLLVARWGNPRTIARGTLLVAVCMLPLALIPHPAAAGIGYVAFMAVFALTLGPMRVFSQELVTPRWQATMAAAFMMGAGLGISTLSFGGGFMAATWGYRSVFLAGAGVMAAAALTVWARFGRPHTNTARATVSGDGD